MSSQHQRNGEFEPIVCWSCGAVHTAEDADTSNNHIVCPSSGCNCQRHVTPDQLDDCAACSIGDVEDGECSLCSWEYTVGWRPGGKIVTDGGQPRSCGNKLLRTVKWTIGMMMIEFGCLVHPDYSLGDFWRACRGDNR